LTFRTPAASTTPRHGELHSLNAEYRGDFVFVTTSKLTHIKIDAIIQLSELGTAEGSPFQSGRITQKETILAEKNLKPHQLPLFNIEKRGNGSIKESCDAFL
jgi:hypothetical protein